MPRASSARAKAAKRAAPHCLYGSELPIPIVTRALFRAEAREDTGDRGSATGRTGSASAIGIPAACSQRSRLIERMPGKISLASRGGRFRNSPACHSHNHTAPGYPQAWLKARSSCCDAAGRPRRTGACEAPPRPRRKPAPPSCSPVPALGISVQPEDVAHGPFRAENLIGGGTRFRDQRHWFSHMRGDRPDMRQMPDHVANARQAAEPPRRA